jgi:hypothetical protein
MTKNSQEIIETDISKLDEKGLENFMYDLQDYRLNKTNCNSISAGECSMLLNLVVSEKNSRSSGKLARLAIIISVLSFVASLFFSIMSILFQN